MATISFKFLQWFNNFVLVSVMFAWPFDIKPKQIYYAVDWDYYKARTFFFLFAGYTFFTITMQIMKIMDNFVDLRIKKAKAKAREELAEYIRVKTQKLKENEE